jgi:hypothetical protein
MATLTKIDSNVTGLRYCEEDSYKVVSGDEVWYPLEPNSYNDFGGQITTIARNPINPSRQRKKGVVTDLDASGGFETDITQTNLQDLLQGFFFASLRLKGEFGDGNGVITAVTAAGDDYAGTDIEDEVLVGSLVWATSFTNTENNGLKTVATLGTNLFTVSEALVDETPGATAKVVQVGHQFAADDLNVVAGASFPQITSDAAFDFTTLGLIPGEWLYIGGDGALLAFPTNATNNGHVRIRSVSATAITLDKAEGTMVSETLTGGETIQIFFGRVLKNEAGTSVVRRTYQLERQLGAPDDASPAEIQAEYIVGAVPSEFEFNIPTADKATASLTFIGADNETIDGPTALKAGTRPALVEADAFNTSSDIARIKMAIVSTTDAAPTALFAYLTDLTISINNNVSPNKAVGTLGAFEVTAGTFEIGGSMTAYFADVAAVDAVRANADITLDAHLVKANSGITLDIPLISLGDGRPNVEQDQAITLPLSMEAATGAKVDSNLDHTLLMCFYDYLPDAAE